MNITVPICGIIARIRIKDLEKIAFVNFRCDVHLGNASGTRKSVLEGSVFFRSDVTFTFTFIHYDIVEGFKEGSLGVLGFKGWELAVGVGIKKMLSEHRLDITKILEEDIMEVFIVTEDSDVSAGLEVVEDTVLVDMRLVVQELFEI